MTYIPDTLSQKNNYVLLYQVDAKIDMNVIQEVLSRAKVDTNDYEILSFIPSIARRPDSNKEWKSVCRESSEWLLELKRKIAFFPNKPTFHVFSHTPIPLAVYFGALLLSWDKIISYQYNQTDNSWYPWADAPDKNDFFEVVSQSTEDTAKDILLLISVTRPVIEHVRNLKVYENNKNNILCLNAKTISQNSVASSAVAIKAASEIVTKLDQVIDNNPNIKNIHLFLAGPVALAFLIGRKINPNVFPNIIVYNFFPRQNPVYRGVCQINKSSLSNTVKKYISLGEHPVVKAINFILVFFILVLGIIVGYKLVFKEFGQASWFVFSLILMITLLMFEMIHQETFEEFIRQRFFREK